MKKLTELDGDVAIDDVVDALVPQMLDHVVVHGYVGHVRQWGYQVMRHVCHLVLPANNQR